MRTVWYLAVEQAFVTRWRLPIGRDYLTAENEISPEVFREQTGILAPQNFQLNSVDRLVDGKTDRQNNR